MPLVLRYVGASKAVPALGKEKDRRRERKLRHRAEKGVSAQIKALILLFPGKEKTPTLSICNILGQGLPCLNTVLCGDPPARACWLHLKEREENPSLFSIKPQNAPFGWARFGHSINSCRFPSSGQQPLRVRNTETGSLCREPSNELTE